MEYRGFLLPADENELRTSILQSKLDELKICFIYYIWHYIKIIATELKSEVAIILF